ncbi:MAG: hypothetical protein A3F73_13555 [Gallionellales bacterium RIFCSPLOWO2_12_FULL_59_22]|nr:MAG: hypothetical protein A3H99_03100 [Gallionellales bacterium RIFCSPLOWO2_02_FULL_59_110]OGT05710.1 MAG: hypothetical protein A2Z65_05480 [Gallionellales bacterium RIFCSPLOWO2_02_58_13]OGT13950.1 MAG: hypothetical protein A3F73_13555 [Gallionellales bacterium RIFCSPLOWO2_12_FULL_59_22]
MKLHNESGQPLPSANDGAEAMHQDRMAAHDHINKAGASTRFPLLRRLSLISLLAMLATATILILLYRQDQIDEHTEIAALQNEQTATRIIQLIDGHIYAYVSAAAGLDAQAMRSNPAIGAFNAILNTVRDHSVLKLKLYNSSGIVVFSTVPDDIGKTSHNRATLEKALASETQHKLEFRDTFSTSAGNIHDRHILQSYVPLDHEGKRVGVLETYADITPAMARIRANTAQIAMIVFGAFAALYAGLFFSARRADRAIAEDTRKLAESEMRLWTTVNSALDAIISIDAESRLIGFNPAAEAMFGWQEGDVVGRAMVDMLIPERYRERHLNGLARYMQSGETHILNRRIEISALRRDGTEFPIELTITPIREGDRTLFTAFIRDIAERKRAEEAQQEALLRLQLITRQVPGVVYQFRQRPDGSYCFPFASEAAREIFRVDPEKIREDAARAFAVIHPDDYDRIAASIAASARDLTPWRHEFRSKFDDGTVRWLQGDSIPQREADGSTLWHGFITDVTARKQAEEELRTSRAFHQSITDAMGEIGIGLFIVDADYRVRFMNAVMKKWFGDQTGKICYSSVGGASERCAYCRLDDVLCENQTVHYSPDTRGRAFDIIATPIQNEDGSISKLEVVRDITQLRQTEQELRIAAKAFESQEGMFITDARSVIQRSNVAFTRMTGYSADEVVGKTPAIFNSGRHDIEFFQAMWEALRRDEAWQGEIWNRRKNGEIYPTWQTITAVPDSNGQITHYISAFSDISKRKEAEEKIRNLAFYDPLTRLPNRQLLLDRLHQALALSVRTGRQGALLFIDLDNFKSINDTQGHAAGDLLLVEAAKRLQTCVREGDTIARLGGDEFVVLLEDLDTDEQAAAGQAETVGEKVREILGQPCLVNDHEYHGTTSIGITLFRGQVKTMEEMLKRADVALYQAKSEGRNTVRFFDPAMQASVSARVALESDLRRAVTLEQFLLYYQPQVDSSGRLVGAEALVRWKHPERGMVSPAEFIPLAEESGLILPLGHWVMSTACEQLIAWAAQPETAHLTIAVNVSGRQFGLPTFVDEVLTLVDYYKIDPTKLKLEVTESLLLDNVDDVIAKMTMLKNRGISFSMDDFGTGYSSLSYLKRLPLYQLKIDQSFVRDVLTDPNDATIAKIIVSLAQSMNLVVIAEGVETEAQREFLELYGCHAYQGYLFSKPVPIEDFARLIEKYA